MNDCTCGDGIVSEEEECDGGDCCDSVMCQFLPSSTVCRVSAGECDVAETCTGSSASCPADIIGAIFCTGMTKDGERKVGHSRRVAASRAARGPMGDHHLTTSPPGELDLFCFIFLLFWFNPFDADQTAFNKDAWDFEDNGLEELS